MITYATYKAVILGICMYLAYYGLKSDKVMQMQKSPRSKAKRVKHGRHLNKIYQLTRAKSSFS